MLRYMEYGLCLDEGQELSLIRNMSQAASFGPVAPGETSLSYHGYVLENAKHKIYLTPEQLALLHEAIHEMVAKSDELRDVLTDGAAEDIIDPRVLGPGELRMLYYMSRGHYLCAPRNVEECWFTGPENERQYRPWEALVNMKSRSLIEPIEATVPDFIHYHITDAGRAALEADDAG